MIPLVRRWTATACAVCAARPFEAAWPGFAASHRPMHTTSDYWATARSEAGWRAGLAGRQAPEDWKAAAKRLFDLPGAEAQVLTDPARGIARIAFQQVGRLLAALFAAPEALGVMRDHLVAMRGRDNRPRLRRPAGSRSDPSRVSALG